MTKAEKIVKELQDKGIHTYNLSEQVDILSAMQEQSVKFAEWLRKTNWAQSCEDNRWYSFDVQDTGITTAALYEIFNKL